MYLRLHGYVVVHGQPPSTVRPPAPMVATKHTVAGASLRPLSSSELGQPPANRPSSVASVAVSSSSSSSSSFASVGHPSDHASAWLASCSSSAMPSLGSSSGLPSSAAQLTGATTKDTVAGVSSRPSSSSVLGQPSVNRPSRGALEAVSSSSSSSSSFASAGRPSDHASVSVSSRSSAMPSSSLPSSATQLTPAVRVTVGKRGSVGRASTSESAKLPPAGRTERPSAAADSSYVHYR